MRKKAMALITFSLVAIVSLFAGLSVVQAEDVVQSYDVCVSSGLYGVTWNTNVSTAVQPSMIDEAALKSGYVAFPEGITEAEKAKYKIDVTFKTGSCYVDNNDGGKIKTCPTNDEKNLFQNHSLLDTEQVNGKYRYKYIEMSLNPTTLLFQVRIKDIYNGKAKIRLVTGHGEPNTANTQSDGTMTFLRKENGYFIIDNVQPSGLNIEGETISTNQMLLEVYLNDSSSPCNNTYIAKADLVIDSVGEGEVANPAYTDPASYGCTDIENYIRYMVSKGIYYDASKPANELVASLKSSYSPMCFVNKTISYTDLTNLKQQIQQDYQTLKALFPASYEQENAAYSPVDSSTGLYCDDGSGRNYAEQYRIVGSYSGTYWGASCQERYEVNYDHAKLVRAGGGFTYTSSFKAIRECTIYQKAKAIRKPQCYSSCRAVCTFPNGTTMSHAGPNSDFDSCVQSCDGGTYSQECINSCYSDVYGSKSSRDLSSLNEKLALDRKDFLNVERTSNIVHTWSLSDPGCNKSASGADFGVDFDVYHCIASCGNDTVETDISTGCDAAGASCSAVSTVGPAGCSWNPQADYDHDISQSQSELDAAKALTNQVQNTGNYKIRIADSYLEKNGVAYVYEVDTNDIVSSKETSSGCPGGNSTVALGDSGGPSATFCTKNSTETTVSVRLAEAYLNRRNGNAVYKKGGGYYAYSSKSGATTLQRTSFTASSFYSKEYRYYTNLLSRNVNVVIPEDYEQSVKLLSDESYWSQGKKQDTITVNVSSFGTGGRFSKQINCYYGVYNDLFIQPDDPTLSPYGPNGNGTGGPGDGTGGGPGDGGDNCPECSNGGLDYGGITFIYRTIELTDEFPNERNPRWNWTDGAAVAYNPDGRLYSLLNYKVDPIGLTRDIEDKGYSIYSDPEEVDYDIVLTTQQILNIRRYNKNVEDYNEDGSENYLDYDMSCANIRGRDVCTSRFLNNADYVTYSSGYSATKRQDVAVCNNTKSYGSTCDD